ncbi:MAG: helix-turn-helix domain-containing protein [Vicinamibacterales bacterium]
MSSKRGSGTAESAEQRLGPELKRLREATGISLRTLADRAGFSPSFISQVENGQVSPSIASLEQIAATLHVSLADFFATPQTSEVVVVRANARPSFRSSWSRARIDSVTPAGKGQPLEAMMVTIDAGGSSGKQAFGVASDQLAVVFSGELTLTLAEDTLELGVGDAVLIRAQTPHRWQNRERTSAQVLLVSPRGSR